MNNLKITAALGFEIRTVAGAKKYGIRVQTKGVWVVMARKGSKEKGGLLYFKRAQDRDRHIVMLMATFGPAVHEERLRMKKRITKREILK